MKREIKFRAWHIELKRWINLNGFDIAFKGCNNEGEVYGIYEQGNLNTFAKEDVQLMQYTGLKDKNGVEIYEGDIIPHPTHGNLIVDFEPTMAVFCFWKNKKSGLGYPMHFDLHTATWEVIGNVHENPELL